MNEHEDDVEPEVEEGAEIETEDFPILSDEENDDESSDIGAEPDVDPDKSEM